ncbi:MAG: DUF935 family protein [Bacteroidetes bacterium]|nr:MAG: DUF935 family protein [Bacteroidota bacterium]
MRFNLRNMLGLAAKSTTPEGGAGQDRRQATSLIIRKAKVRAKKDIDTWRSALKIAEKIPDPRRYKLLEQYDDAVLDGHLHGQMQKRKQRTLASRFNVYNSSGEPDEELTRLFKAPWFGKLLNHALDSIFWGHSLIEIKKVEALSNAKGGILDVQLVPREHVCPEDGLLLKNPTDSSGINYREFPDFQGWLFETPDHGDLGLLNKALPHFIYKKFGTSGWSEYSDLFGMPLRVGKTNTQDPKMIAQLQRMMDNQGSAPYVIIDESEQLEFVETTRGDGGVFKGLIELANSEISKLINGSVMGEADQGGSRSKEEVAERSQFELSQMDKEWLENWINYHVFPILIQHGYPLDGATFEYEEQKDIQQLWRMTHDAMQYYSVDEAWIDETFGIPVTGERQTNTVNPSQNADG